MESTEGGLSVQNTTEAVFDAIKQMVVTGVLRPGEKIRQMELADRLQVSRTPLVKALHKLETSGFVRSIQGRGFYVHQVTAKEVLDLYALREALDSMIALDICGRFPPELIAELEESFETVSPAAARFRPAAVLGDGPAFPRNDSACVEERVCTQGGGALSRATTGRSSPVFRGIRARRCPSTWRS